MSGAGVVCRGLWVAALWLCAQPVAAEWYVAGQAGANFADQLKNIQGTGSLAALQAPDFDLKNAVVYGGKLGVFPGHGAVGIELDAFHSTPHIKSLQEIPGIHMQVTNEGLNIVFRYPGETFQPYAGIGGAVLIARIGDSPTTCSDSEMVTVQLVASTIEQCTFIIDHWQSRHADLRMLIRAAGDSAGIGIADRCVGLVSTDP